MSKTKPPKTKMNRNSLVNVERQLFAIYQHSKDLTSPEAEVTNSDMKVIMEGALSALKTLGWVPKAKAEPQQQATKADLLRNVSVVRINRNVRPHGGRKFVLVRVNEDNDTVVVQFDTKAGNSMMGADLRTYRFDEVEPVAN